MRLFDLDIGISTTAARAALGPLADVESAGKRISETFKATINPLNMMKSALAGVSIAAAGLAAGRFLKGAIAEAADAEQQMQRLRVAIENAGGDFASVAPEADKMASAIQRVTRFSDDAVTGALAQMVVITSDVAGSMRNMTLATDLAANQQIPLANAAEIVARAMAGNNQQLQRMFPSLKDNANALGELSRMLGGSAAADAQTFTGRLEQMRNAWKRIQEAIGEAILGTNASSASTNKAADALNRVGDWVTAHQADIRTLAEGLGKAALGMAALAEWGLKVSKLDFSNVMAIARWTPAGMQLRALSALAGGMSSPGVDPLASDPGLAGIARRGVDFADVSGTSSTRRVLRPQPVAGAASPRRMSGTPGFAGLGAPTIQGVGLPQLTPLEGTRILPDLPFDEVHQQLAEFEAGVSSAVDRYIVGGIGDALHAGFTAAFSGEGIGGLLKGFTSGIVGSLGQMFIELGKHLIGFGTIMTNLKNALSEMFLAGPGAVIAGAALIALGAAMTAGAGSIMSGGGRGSSSGSYSTGAGIGGGFSDNTSLYRYNPATMDMTKVNAGAPVHVVNYNFGMNDPVFERKLSEATEKAARRGRV